METTPKQPKFCGFSMGASQVRRCIKGECEFWVDTEEQIKTLLEESKENGLDETEMKNEIEEFRRAVGEGFCIFHNL